ncbi:MAG TPA: sodium:proton antiporter [candidate division Zixibacteria bacterium]|nr:sodium:proton antiporter [candidate division Zixibacteria bacterium]
MALWNRKKSQAQTAQADLNDEGISRLEPGLGRVKNIIAIASGKGGVGKSTVATNLAFALKETGASVGLMDADIYGPSQPGMLGAELEPPHVVGGQLQPSNRHGMSFISMGLFLGGGGPVIWRAPIAMKMIQQFIANVLWGELDYLLIDLPPGTGDVQLTLAQQAQLTGAIIVTTPQEVALGVARKGLKMFEQVNVPILGIVENMSGFICRHCGKETDIFGAGGGKTMAIEMNVPFLGAIPLDPAIMSSGEEGVPVLAKDRKSGASKAYIALVQAVEKSIDDMKASGNLLEPEQVEMADNGELHVRWPDSHQSIYTPHHLRVNCHCANCVNEDTGLRTLDPAHIPLDIKISDIKPVGRYAMAISFSDGHNTGIYTFKRLRDLCECPEHSKKGESFEV